MRSILPDQVPLFVENNYPIGHCLEYGNQLGSLLLGFRMRRLAVPL
jgi:hypothetical protein